MDLESENCFRNVVEAGDAAHSIDTMKWLAEEMERPKYDFGQHAGACFRSMFCVHTPTSWGATFNMILAGALTGWCFLSYCSLPQSTEKKKKKV